MKIKYIFWFILYSNNKLNINITFDSFYKVIINEK